MGTPPITLSVTLSTAGEILDLQKGGSVTHIKVTSGVALFGPDATNATFPIQQEDGIWPIPHTVQDVFAKAQAGSAQIEVIEFI